MSTTDVANRSSLLTIEQAARQLGVHPLTVRRYIDSGVLPAVQPGGKGHSLRVDERDEMHKIWTRTA
jgi:excisionase family DNA binding protein